MSTGEADLRFLVGLGNPGGKYRETYHNLGFQAIRHFGREFEVESRQKHSAGEVLTLGGEAPVQYASRPDTYVNRSGEAVQAWRDEFNLTADQFLIIYDDFELELGQIRLRPGGSSGGHRGLQNIIDSLNTREIPRLRIGIGPLPTNSEPRDFVLAKITEDDRKIFSRVYDTFPRIVESIVRTGYEQAMDTWNGVNFDEPA